MLSGPVDLEFLAFLIKSVTIVEENGGGRLWSSGIDLSLRVIMRFWGEVFLVLIDL